MFSYVTTSIASSLACFFAVTCASYGPYKSLPVSVDLVPAMSRPTTNPLAPKFFRTIMCCSASRGPAMRMLNGKNAHLMRGSATSFASARYVATRVTASMSPGCVGPTVGCTSTTELGTSASTRLISSKCALWIGLRHWNATTGAFWGREPRSSAGDAHSITRAGTESPSSLPPT